MARLDDRYAVSVAKGLVKVSGCGKGFVDFSDLMALLMRLVRSGITS